MCGSLKTAGWYVFRRQQRSRCPTFSRDNKVADVAELSEGIQREIRGVWRIGCKVFKVTHKLWN